MKRDKTNRAFDYTIILLIIFFSFFMSFMAGQRGHMPTDQSITFDGGYRVLTGQIPFKDFVFTHSLIAFWLVALFFKFLGVNYMAFLVCAAAINAAATICSIIITRLVFKERYLSYMAGFLTAVWFNTPFHTPQAEQVAALLSFVVMTILLFILCGKIRNSSLSSILLFISGSAAFVPFLARQNAGMFIVPTFFLIVIAASLSETRLIWRRIVIFSLGILTGAALFLLWLMQKSDLNNFLHYFIALPSSVGVDRIKAIINEFTWMEMIKSLPIIIIPASVIGLYFYNFNEVKFKWRTLFIASILCVSTILFQILFRPTSNSKFTFFFIGIIASIGTGLLFYLFNLFVPMGSNFSCGGLKMPPRKVLKTALIVLVSVLFFVYSAKGLRHSFKVGEQMYPSYREISASELKPLKWGEPTMMGDSSVTTDDIDKLVGHLKERDQNFFVFPELFVLYGVMGKPSPQPLLWFDKGLTYPKTYDPVLDTWIVNGLKQNKVEIVVIEEIPPPDGTLEMLDDFPKLKSYIFENFTKSNRIGIFAIYNASQ